jgi:predicted exporter
MEPKRQKLVARIILLAFAALGGLWLLRLDYAEKISTNILDLIPADERSPELTLVRSLAGEQQARVQLFAVQLPAGSDPATLPQAATAFADALKKSPVFSDIAVVDDPAAREKLGRYLFDRRLELLLPTWLAERQRAFAATAQPPETFDAWLAGQTVAALDAFVAKPESIAFEALVPSDPLLLVPTLAAKAQSIAAPAAAGSGQALVWALLKESPFTDAGQEPAFRAIAQATTELRTRFPAATVRWSGVNRFAAESKQQIRAELGGLNTLSLLAVVGVACLFVRRLWKVLHLVPVVLLATLAAWVATTIAFDRVHILVFVVGSLLAGVAIDYGFYLYMQPALRPDEPYREKVARLLKPLLASCLTTVLGFSLLLWSELPLVRQLGVYVSAGLLGALGAALLYFAQLERPFLETRAIPTPRADGRHRNGVRLLAICALLVALIGPWRLRWHDDVRSLEVPLPELRANDAELRALFGESPDRVVYLTRGDTPAAARSALARFLAWHDEKHPDAPAASAGLMIPTEEDWRDLPARLNALERFEPELRAALLRGGYLDGNFAPFFDRWQRLRARTSFPSYAELLAGLHAHLTGPLSLLFQPASNGPSWFLTIAPHPPDATNPPAEFASFTVDQLQSLNTLFSRYRISTVRLSAIGLSLIGASVFVLYGIRRGVRIFAIPAGSCFFSLGLLGLLNAELNIFHLLGAFLGVCLSHNYAIFSAENANRHEPPPPSIRLSALTTAASFGVLAISKIPVIAALGATVALIVMTALIMVELEPLSRRKDSAA